MAELRRRIDALLPTGGYLTITGQPGQGKSNPIKITIEIDGAPLKVEAPDVVQAEAALKLALQFCSVHPTVAPQITAKSKVKVQGRVPIPSRKRGRHR